MKDLVEQYIDLAIKHGECTLEGDSSNGNKVHAKMMRIIGQIKIESKGIRDLFFETLKHDNDSVKMWTAVTLLKTKESESTSVLQQIASTNKTIHGLSAETTLDCWEKDMLTNITDWEK